MTPDHNPVDVHLAEWSLDEPRDARLGTKVTLVVFADAKAVGTVSGADPDCTVSARRLATWPRARLPGVSTPVPGVDALSYRSETIWNVNADPVSYLA